ncbi:MAG: sigma-70 family RNA polymerase sigma factor [Clostridia bacterium]|nr:sigma-70 family RNA polymerase sigma factor [Clostridia bacterium]
MRKIEELVKRAKTGDKDAYSELILSVQSYLFNFAKSRLNNEEDAQDAVQATIVNAYMGIQKLRNNENFKTWITRILINECNKMYKHKKKDSEIIAKYTSNTRLYTNNEETTDFDSMIRVLNDTEKRMFELYYKEELSIKQISKIMNIKESTIRGELSRGRSKIRRTFKPSTIFVFILCMFIVTSVIAVSIISYIKNLFDTDKVGIDNSGVLEAIENRDWFQEVEMNYIDIGNGNKIKIDYILMDEMNLYMVFDLESEKDISDFEDFSIYDLKVENENGELICDKANSSNIQYQKTIGSKMIEKSKHHIKTLVYMYTDSFPISKTLNIDFTKVHIYKKGIFNKKREILNTNAKIKLELDNKFVNREYTEYISNNSDIKKTVITETGFYALIKCEDYILDDVILLDEFQKNIICNKIFIDGINDIEYIINCNYRNNESKILILSINNEEIKLEKKD